ncbi:hypothetical protein [Aeromonas sp. MdU4]|uniref:hypothetical protein n=1 Tax=Aeromonas sp. MdU4 TaxID=3342819 RepID=UPI0035BB2856
MALKGSIHKMHVATLMAFEDEIRRVGYGQSEHLIGWLLERGVKGIKARRSAACTGVKVSDAACGRDVNSANEVANMEGVNALYRRLGELDYESEQIIDRLRIEIAGSDDKGAH